MKQVGDQGVSAKTIERVVHDVGPELARRRDADPKTDEALAMRPASPPELAVVECDGGRIRTREPGHGPGVHRTTEGWRETKNAVLIRASRTVSDRRSSTRATGLLLRLGACGQDRRDRGAARSPRRCPAQPRISVGRTAPSQPSRLEPTIGAPSGWSAPCSPASPSRRFSASRWSARPSDGDSSRPRPRRSWGMGCPGTGRSGRSTSPTSRRSWISSTC